MTSLHGPFEEDISFCTKHYHAKNRHYHALKSKNVYNSKCSKYLKRKFKKYKLRHDGKEDPEVLDVSNFLITSLRIKSPSKKECFNIEFESKPKNYLFRMVRTKQNIFTEDYSSNSCEVDVQNDTGTSPVTNGKKETNAFKLLMDSRNKSIGSNSPGKEKPIDEVQEQQILEKKDAKVKRNLLLQKMAEAKGSLKKKELEEQQDRIIKKKMKKRADKLKSMILNKEPKAAKIEEQNSSKSVAIGKTPTKKEEKLEKPTKTLQLVSIFNETVENKISPERKILKEDAEFLSKLSPSLRKKESMLSYFKKVEKDDDPIAADSENDRTIIKVKFTSTIKKKGKNKRRLILQDNSNNDKGTESPPVHEEIKEKNTERRKRKRNLIVSCETKEVENNSSINDDIRPRRNVKKPVKYSEDMYISSSDEELHIFTPKKKKNVDKKMEPLDVIVVEDYKSNRVIKRENKETLEKKKPKERPLKEKKNELCQPPKKLAPIFMKSQPNPAEIEAKQKFLQSGVPEQLKKLIAKQKNASGTNSNFLKVVHVQQLDELANYLLPIDYKFSIDHEAVDQDTMVINQSIFQNFLNLSSIQLPPEIHPYNQNSVQVTLQFLKDSYLRFPVYRTYRLLRSKKKGEYKDNPNYIDIHNSIEIVNCSIDEQTDNPEQLNWCDKYKPLTTSQIIGNFDATRELKKWLVSWTEIQLKSKAAKTTESSDSSDFCYSDTDSKENSKSNNNLLILSGPVGCGKTSSVYAVAAELSIKVIEVNASSRRTGKIMLQDLQEATQSHKVNRGTTSNENSQSSQKSQDSDKKLKKRGRPKKKEDKILKAAKEQSDKNSLLTPSQDSTRTGMSLILIDDADIVFEQDDGFCSAISQLVCSSKRPVILITSTLSCPHLQKFIQTGKILNMNPLTPNMLGTWLDIMCLADSGNCSPGNGAKFLDFFNGDIRKTINCLQFYISSQDQSGSDMETFSQNIDSGKYSNEDENSNMSWIDQPENSIQFDKSLNSDYVWRNFINNQISWQRFKYPLDLFNIWWSVPKLLCFNNERSGNVHMNNNRKVNDNSLELLSHALDTLSACEFATFGEFNNSVNVTSNPWFTSETASVSEVHSIIKYDKKYEINHEISHELLTRTFSMAQDKLGVKNKYDLDFPGMSVQRQKDKITSRHNYLNSSFSPQAILDRRSLALDYWSTCRTICRTEKLKTDTNFKRNNRFCHYLKSLGVHCSSESYDNLADSLTRK